MILALLALACVPALRPHHGPTGSVYRNQDCVAGLPHDTQRAPSLAEGQVMVEVLTPAQVQGAIGARFERYGAEYWLIRSEVQVTAVALVDLALKVEINAGGRHLERCQDCETEQLAKLLDEVQVTESPERIAAQKRNQLVGVGRLFTGVLSGGLLLGLVPRSLYKDVPPAEYTFGGSATDRLQQLLTEPECFARPGETCDEGTLATSVYPYDPSAFRKDELQLHLVHRQGEGGWMSSCRITEVLRLPLADGASLPEQVAALFPDGPRTLADLRQQGFFD